MIKRVFLLLVVNILVITTITIVLGFLGVGSFIDPSAGGLDYGSLFIFCACFGFVGAFISLGLSRIMAKMMMRVKVINPTKPGTSLERDLISTVHRLARKAGLPAMPEVGIYQSPEVNAFATGPTKSRALVAVSTGLLERMDTAAVEGVLSHEIAHVANGDMVTMTLIQGVINTFVMFLARVAAWGITQAMGGRDRDSGPSPLVYHMVVILFQIVLSIFGSMVVNYFSRWREFRADAGGATLAGKQKMIHALQALGRSAQLVDESHESVATLKINGKKEKSKGFMHLFSTHPSLESRIAALQASSIG